MRQIIWFDPEPMVVKALELYWKTEKVPCYVGESLQQDSYIIADLKPDLLIVDSTLIAKDESLELLKASISEGLGEDFHLIIVGEENEQLREALLKYNLAGFLAKPLPIIDLREKVTKLIEH